MLFENASWIGGGRMLRRRFSVPEIDRESKLCISGLGCFVAFLNGMRVGSDELVPAQRRFPATCIRFPPIARCARSAAGWAMRR